MPERKVLQMAQKHTNSKAKDSSSKLIFSDPILCAQFLKGYVDIPMLKEVRPEDIENVTERYVHMFVEERESDVVNKVHFRGNDAPFFLVSLIEHKSAIDYNVVMQVLRYMVFIWEDYEKEMEMQHEGVSRTKAFKYPPILPVIFYDGRDKWTAETSLHKRVLFSDIFQEYIPDYKCILVQLQDYSNEELMKKKDELSILMMMDRLKDAYDFSLLGKEVDNAYFSETTADSPEYLLNIMVQIIEVFLEKLNVSSEEAEIFARQIKERRMGEFFTQFKGWDVQAIRKEVREETQAETRAEVQEESIEKLIHALEAVNISREMTKQQLTEQYGLSEKEAREKVELYW